jgi:hypothetical protein
MTDQELRALVRDAVARHLAQPALPVSPSLPPVPQRLAAAQVHPSHAIYLTVVNSGDACVIEPSVPCDHCGYCKSHGH